MNRYLLVRSLRLRLLVGTCLVSTITLGLLGIAIYYSIRRVMVQDFDGITMAKAQTLAVTAEQDGPAVRFEFDPRQMPEFSTARRPEFFQTWTQDGKIVLRSASLGEGNLGTLSTSDTSQAYDGMLPDGLPGRFFTMQFFPRVDDHKHASASARPLWIRVGRETNSLNHTLFELRWLLVGLCAAAIVLTAVVLLWVVNRGLMPARKLARHIELFRETDLAQRFETSGVPPELQPIVVRLNDLLDRLHAAFDQERAFTADVAHELRTPLAGLRTTLQVCRSRPRGQAAYESAMDTCLSITGRMQEVIESLLLLARADAGQLKPGTSPFNLQELIEECWTPLLQSAAGRRLNVHFNIDPDCDVVTDRQTLGTILHNLLDNAVCHADEAGTVEVRAQRNDQSIAIRISNTGSKITSEDVPSLTRRFWRGDPNRPNSDRHCGLGLSLCERLSAILKVQMEIESDGGMFAVTLKLPATARAINREIPLHV